MELADLAVRTGLVKSTIMRLAISLEAAGLMVRTTDGAYRLGGEVARLGMIQQESSSLEIQIKPVLEHISEATGETSSFWIRQGEGRTCLFRVNSTNALRFDVQPGTLRPLDKSSSALVLTTFDTPLKGKGRPPALPFFSSGAHTPHVGSIAVPVFGTGGKLLGALAVSGPSVRLTRERVREISPLLLEAASNLSRSLGGLTGTIYDTRPSRAA